MSKYLVGYVGLALLAVLPLFSGCAQELPPRSFVQPNLIQKTDLTGTWYYLQTVADAPPTNGAMFVGQSSSLMKVVFDIEEDYLYARRAEEQIEGSEDACTLALAQGQPCMGQPLAAWRIESQFDIIRQYNSTTGEQTNQIVESQERPWYQREFIRVDWSQQIVTDYVGLGVDIFFSNVQVEPVSYWQADPTKPDALHMERATDAPKHQAEGFTAGEMFYLDITDQMIVTPEQLTACYEENGATECFSYPRCFFGHLLNDCASQNIKVKHSFAKIGPKHDYEPRLWDGVQMDLFGVWDVGLRRVVYNRDYPNTLPSTRRVAARFNVWEESCYDVLPQETYWNQQLADATADKDTAKAQAAQNQLALLAQYRNSTVCSQATATTPPQVALATQSGWVSTPTDALTNQPVDARIPYSQRKLKQIPYYAEGSLTLTYNNDPDFPDGLSVSVFPETLYNKFVNIVGSWNTAMKTAVMDMTGTCSGNKMQCDQDSDCIETCVAKKCSVSGGACTADSDCNKTAYTCAKTMPSQDIFVPCHSPVRPSDPAACAADLYPLIDANGNPVNDKHGNPILMPRQGDPRRSEVFWVNQPQAAGPLGYGPPLFDDVTGETISGQAYIYGAALDSYVTRSRDLVLLQNGEVDIADFTNGDPIIDFLAAHPKGLGSSTAYPTITPAQLKVASKNMDFSWAKGYTPKNGYPAIDKSSAQSLLSSINLRSALVENNRYAGASSDARTTALSRVVGSALEPMLVTPDTMADADVSPLRTWDQLLPAEKASVSPLRFASIEAQREADRENFESIGVDFATFDDPGLAQHLLKYRQQYCPGVADTDDCPLTPHADAIAADLEQNIFYAVTLHEVGHNMGCRHNFRGSYDAMNYFPKYWQVRTDAATMNGATALHPRYLNVPGGALTQYEMDNQIIENQYSSIMDYGAEYNSDLQGLGLYDKAMIKFAYAQYVEVFTDVKTDGATLDKISSLQTFQTALGFPTPLGAGAGLTGIPYQTYPTFFNSGWQGIYKRSDFAYNALVTQTDASGSAYQSDSNGNPLVPYYFCSDEYAGNLTCQRFDSGADPYEQAADIVSRYRNLYLTNNFWRQKVTFYSSAAYGSRIRDRYFDKLREQLTWYVLLRGDFQGDITSQVQTGGCDPANPECDEDFFFTDENGWGAFTAGVNLGFETLGQVITQPTIGIFLQQTDPTGQKVWGQINPDPQDGANLGNTYQRVDYLDGRYIDTSWDQATCGYYWYDDCQTRIGYMIDKIAALDELSQSQAYFTGRDTTADVRQYAIGYIVPYKKQIEEKFGAIFAGNTDDYAPYFRACSTVEANNGVCAAPGTLIPVLPSWTSPNPSAAPTAQRIDPSTGFTVQLYAGVYGLSSFPTTFDQEFIDTTNVFVVGNGEATTPDTTILSVGTYDETQLVSMGGTKTWYLYTDPTSGKIYAAHATPTANIQYLDSSAAPTSPTAPLTTTTVPLRNDQGVRMLSRLNALANGLTAAQNEAANDPNKESDIAAAQTAYNNYYENIEVMRSLHNAFGYGVYRTDAPFYY